MASFLLQCCLALQALQSWSPASPSLQSWSATTLRPQHSCMAPWASRTKCPMVWPSWSFNITFPVSNAVQPASGTSETCSSLQWVAPLYWDCYSWHPCHLLLWANDGGSDGPSVCGQTGWCPAFPVSASIQQRSERARKQIHCWGRDRDMIATVRDNMI